MPLVGYSASYQKVDDGPDGPDVTLWRHLVLADLRSQKNAIDTRDVARCALVQRLGKDHGSQVGQLDLDLAASLESVLHEHHLRGKLIQAHANAVHLLDLSQQLQSDRTYL